MGQSRRALTAPRSLPDPLLTHSLLRLPRSSGPWYTPELSYNPSIHTLKAFQQHQAIASPTDRPPAMHQDLTRFFKPPAEVVEATKGLGKRVADVLDLRPGESPDRSLLLGRRRSAACETDPP